MFRNDEINVSEKRIKANMPLHFELGGLVSGWAYIRNSVFVGKWMGLYPGGLKRGGGFKVGFYGTMTKEYLSTHFPKNYVLLSGRVVNLNRSYTDVLSIV